MLNSSWLLCLWPGLARLWTRGEWASLILAIGFGAMLNLALVSSLRWPELLGSGFPTLIWPILTGIWIVSALISHYELKQRRIKRNSSADLSPVPDTLFIQAQREYLKRNWEAAETMLQRRLQFRPRDVEARLLLATMLRRLGRWDESLLELETLGRFDESEPWTFEIAAERSAIATWKSQEPEDDSAHELHDDSTNLRFEAEPAETQPAENNQRRVA